MCCTDGACLGGILSYRWLKHKITMGFLSRIKDFGSSIGVLAKLCDKTWDMVGSEEKNTYIFKTNKQLHYIVNGKSAQVPYEFIANSNTLIIYFLGVSGASYHLKFVNENTLILIDEEVNKTLCYANRNGKNAPSSEIEAFRQYFSKREEFIRLRRAEARKMGLQFHYLTNDVDDAIEGLDEGDIIHCVDVFREFIPDFEFQYLIYLGNYQRATDPDVDITLIDREIFSGMERARYAHNSKALNLYIEKTGDSVYRYP